MNPLLLKLLISVAVEILTRAYGHWESLPPEEKERLRQVHAEWVKKCRELDDPMGGSMEGP